MTETKKKKSLYDAFLDTVMGLVKWGMILAVIGFLLVGYCSSVVNHETPSFEDYVREQQKSQ